MSCTVVLNSKNRANPTENANDAIYNFDWTALDEGEYKVTWGFTKRTPIQYTDYLNFKTYTSYHSENPLFPNNAVLFSSGLSQNYINLTTGVNNTLPLGNTSVLWTGFFFTGENPTGSYSFFLSCDDGGYLWIGDTATQGYTVNNSFINNSGNHAVVEVGATMTMTTNTFYPIRILYGDSGGDRNCLLTWTNPSSTTKISNGLGRFFH